MSTPSPVPHDALVLARQARQAALLGDLGDASDLSGLAQLRLLEARGPDAARFLHSQLTQDVERLTEGEGALTARVERTGHLQAVASIHRHPDATPPCYWFIGDAGSVARLHASLDESLFSDNLTLTPVEVVRWLVLQGPCAPEIAESVFGMIGFESWDRLPEGALRHLRRAKNDLALPPDLFVIRRSLTGDAGFVFVLPSGDPASLDPVLQALQTHVEQRQGAVADGHDFAHALEVLRVEAGQLDLAADFGDKRRLLPETGLEQQTVSYTKGCYLGQEVIARVRTYGSVPHLLRTLVFEHEPGDVAGSALLSRLPAPGSPLLLADGKRAGFWASRSLSPIAERAIATAFLARAHRTPGRVLDLLDHEGVPLRAEVRSSPLYAAPDQAARVQQGYDLAIRTFADGHPDRALRMMEEVLKTDPSFADAYEAIGVMLGRSGRFHEAIDVFRRLEEVAPNEPMVNTNLSLYYMKVGDRQTAEDEAGKATLKTMAKARGKGGEHVADDLLESKRKEAQRKVAMFERVLGIDPDDGIALFGLGTALLTLDRPAEAEPHLRHALEVDRQNSAVYTAHGRALEALDRHEDAIATYREGVEVASRKGDLMPLREMEHRLLLLGARQPAAAG